MGAKSLEVWPVAAGDTEGDAQSFRVKVSVARSGLVWMRTYSVSSWVDGLWPVWRIAQAYGDCPAILAGLRSSSVALDSLKRPHGIYFEADWMRAFMWGHTALQGVATEFFFRDGDDQEVFRRVFLKAAVQDATAFGEELRRDIVASCPRWVRDEGLLP
jgi:hypothetical protein